MIELIEKIDKEVFLFINGWNGEMADNIMYFVSEKWVWIPLYAFITFLIFKKYGWKTFYIILPILLVIIGTDQLSVLIKNEVGRYRPCHNLDLMAIVHKVNNHCGGTFGFVSSHSANAFGLFAYLGLILKTGFKNLKIILFFWACLLAYSRVYLGVHYPADVLGGALLGILISYLLFKIVKLSYSKINVNYD